MNRHSLLVLVAMTGACELLEQPVDDALSMWTLDGPEVRIGAVDDPDFAFSRVAALAEAPDGTLYSLHPQEAQIRRWSAAGAPEGAVGRRGEGPGEFMAPRSFGFFGDTLWVMDGRAFRVSYFDTEGSFLGSRSPQVDVGSRETYPNDPIRPELPLRDGTFYGRAPAWSQEMATGELTHISHAHMDEAGTVLTTTWVERLRPENVLALLREDGRGGSFFPQPWGDGVLTAASEAGLLVVDRRAWDGEGEARVDMTGIGLAGDTLWERAFSYAPILLEGQRVDSATAADAERFFEFLTRGQPELTQATLESQMGDATYVPDYLPFIRSLRLSREGEIWLEEFEPDEGRTAWRVFGTEGLPLGRVLLPAGFELRLVAGSSLWGIERDEFDVEYIVRYILQRPAAA